MTSMKERSQICRLALTLMTLSLRASAGVTVTMSPVGSATDFPPRPFHAGEGTLGADSSSPSGASGLTIQGGTSQGIPAGTVIGEIFKWSGDKSILTSIDFVDTGSGGKGVYRIFLLDLGTGVFFSPANSFDPKNHRDLLNAGDTITVTNTATKSFVELDFSGTDAITLQTGHSYAFGLLSMSDVSDLFIERSGGGQSDDYGEGFTATSLKDTGASASPFADSVRNVFVGIYSAPVPEPAIK
jgi:hypothetical protein